AYMSRDCLDAGRSVHVGCRAQNPPFFWANFERKRHEEEGALARWNLEILGGILLQDRRREGPVSFPFFDKLVDDVFVFRRAGIREDAAIAEGARAKLGASLDPADNVALSD